MIIGVISVDFSKIEKPWFFGVWNGLTWIFQDGRDEVFGNFKAWDLKSWGKVTGENSWDKFIVQNS